MSARAVGERTPGEARRERAATWVEDLRWHKQMYKQSRYRWTGEHAMAIVTRHTGGQLDFTTVKHLRLLEHYRLEVSSYGQQCRLAMAQPLRDAQETLGRFQGPASEVPGAQWGPGGEAVGRRWAPTANALGLTTVECSATVWFAVGEPQPPTNIDTEHALEHLPFCNPLIQAWELKQVWRLFEAAAGLIEDAMVDLIDELRGSRHLDVLAEAAGVGTPLALQNFIDDVRARRGGPGDPRRVPTQVF